MQKSLTSSIIIPEKIQSDWQNMLDVLSDIMHVPASLITRISKNDIEVISSSNSKGNPYVKGDKEALDQNLYCKYAIEQREQLIVANTLKDTKWNHNPDRELNIISYCGLPIFWPDNTPFGTVCVLDNKENTFNLNFQKLLQTYQKSIEAQLNILFQHTDLLNNHKKLQQEITVNNKHINEVNCKLANEIDCRRAAEQKVEYHKNHDVGTGFLNAMALYRHIDTLINNNKKFILLQIHFANSRTIQHEHGHYVFDLLLTEYRSKLTKITDTSVTGRLDSSDILLIIHADKIKLPQLCQHLSEIGKAYFSNNKEQIHLQSYIGAVHSKENTSRDELLKCAYNTVVECQNLGKTLALLIKSGKECCYPTQHTC